jgi:hypothetical protein
MKKKSHFRYNFPVPPMRTTRIIEPISLEDNVLIEKSKSLFAFLEQGDFDDLMSFQDFLAELNLTEDEYIQAIQSTLKQPTIFLKRKLLHIWNNSFSKDHASYVECKYRRTVCPQCICYNIILYLVHDKG